MCSSCTVSRVWAFSILNGPTAVRVISAAMARVPRFRAISWARERTYVPVSPSIRTSAMPWGSLYEISSNW